LVGRRLDSAASLPAFSVSTRAQGATPTGLIQRGIYATIAVALKGGEWRKTSMVMLAKAFAGSDAVGEEDARKLKRAQTMYNVVQEEMGMEVAPGAAASTEHAHTVADGSTANSSFSLLRFFCLMPRVRCSPEAGEVRHQQINVVELQSSA